MKRSSPSRLRRSSFKSAAEPPVALPPGRLVHIPGRGEFFLRDSGGEGRPVLLLHGWMFPSDLNWLRVYGPLASAGYRVLAIDLRGHGRGLRTELPFRLEDCAADAVAIVEMLDAGPVYAVGYSMGGPVAQLMARDHPEVVAGIVLAATATDWSEARMRALWRTMAGLRLLLNLFPTSAWRAALRGMGFDNSATTSWFAAELSRGSGRDIAEAGRELGRSDSRPWIASLNVPAAVIVTGLDRSVPPRKQRDLALALGAEEFELDGDHDAVVTVGGEFTKLLVQALGALARGGVPTQAPLPVAEPQ